jgi:hypothetical protein
VQPLGRSGGDPGQLPGVQRAGRAGGAKRRSETQLQSMAERALQRPGQTHGDRTAGETDTGQPAGRGRGSPSPRTPAWLGALHPLRPIPLHLLPPHPQVPTLPAGLRSRQSLSLSLLLPATSSYSGPLSLTSPAPLHSLLTRSLSLALATSRPHPSLLLCCHLSPPASLLTSWVGVCVSGSPCLPLCVALSPTTPDLSRSETRNSPPPSGPQQLGCLMQLRPSRAGHLLARQAQSLSVLHPRRACSPQPEPTA